MHAIESLISGLPWAAGGHAELYVRGTSTRATYYTDFEGEQAVTGTNVNLNANGAATVYVNQLVTVIVKDADGATVAEFVSGVAAPSVEVRSLSFTGTDYETGQQAVGNPTNAQAIFDLWIESAGQPNFQVDIEGSPQTLAFLAAVLAGLVFSVKQDGAVGDGATDDRAAILATITRAAVRGGFVVFPPGSYRITNSISIPPGVSLLGCGSSASVIVLDHASNDAVVWAGNGATTPFVYNPRLMVGLQVRHQQTCSGVLVRFDGDTTDAVQVLSCRFLPGVNSTGPILRSSAAGIRDLRFSHCVFHVMDATRLVSENTATNQWTFVSCRTRLSTTYSETAMISAGRVTLSNCWIDNTANTSGTWTLLSVPTTVVAVLVLTGCLISAGAGATITAITVADALDSSDRIYEVGNVIDTDVLYALTLDGNENKVELSARKNRRLATTLSSTPIELDALNYGKHELTFDADSGRSVTLTDCPIGSEVHITYSTTSTASTAATLTIAIGTTAIRGQLTYSPSNATDQIQFIRGTVVGVTGITGLAAWVFEPMAEDQVL